jgi:hypothetical protein
MLMGGSAVSLRDGASKVGRESKSLSRLTEKPKSAYREPFELVILGKSDEIREFEGVYRGQIRFELSPILPTI